MQLKKKIFLQLTISKFDNRSKELLTCHTCDPLNDDWMSLQTHAGVRGQVAVGVADNDAARVLAAVADVEAVVGVWENAYFL